MKSAPVEAPPPDPYPLCTRAFYPNVKSREISRRDGISSEQTSSEHESPSHVTVSRVRVTCAAPDSPLTDPHSNPKQKRTRHTLLNLSRLYKNSRSGVSD